MHFAAGVQLTADKPPIWIIMNEWGTFMVSEKTIKHHYSCYIPCHSIVLLLEIVKCWAFCKKFKNLKYNESFKMFNTSRHWALNISENMLHSNGIYIKGIKILNTKIFHYIHCLNIYYFQF